MEANFKEPRFLYSGFYCNSYLILLLDLADCFPPSPSPTYILLFPRFQKDLTEECSIILYLSTPC